VITQRVVIDRCPFHGFSYFMEDFLVKMWVQESKGNPALPYWTAPAWINEAIGLIGNIQARNQAEIHDKLMKGKPGGKPKTVL